MNPFRFLAHVPLVTLALMGIGAAAWGIDHIGVIIGSVLVALFQI